MVFCGRRTYTDANGKCHNIAGMKVNEIRALVEGSDHSHMNTFGCRQQGHTVCF
jgi:hypothetical protein